MLRAEGLFDVRFQYKDLIVVVPKQFNTLNVYDEAMNMVSYPWRKDYGAQSLVIDTITTYADRFLDVSADVGNYTNNPISMGQGKNKTIIAAEGDYRVGQQLTREVTTAAFLQDMDLCIIGHVGVLAKGKRGTAGFDVLSAGIATVGQAQVNTYGGQFDQYVRLKYKAKQDQTNLVAQIMGDAVYAAKVREDSDEVIPRELLLPKQYELQLKWWHELATISGIDLNAPPDDPVNMFRMALYGDFGTGKTRLACNMVRTPIVYLAIDANSAGLRSVARQRKEPRLVAA